MSNLKAVSKNFDDASIFLKVLVKGLWYLYNVLVTDIDIPAILRDVVKYGSCYKHRPMSTTGASNTDG